MEFKGARYELMAECYGRGSVYQNDTYSPCTNFGSTTNININFDISGLIEGLGSLISQSFNKFNTTIEPTLIDVITFND
jgi:hypothetical protein